MAPPSPAHGLLRAEYRDAAVQLAARLAALSEPAMRSAALATELAGMGGLRAIWTLEAVIRGVLARQSACIAVYDAMLDPEPLMQALGEERLDEMLRAGRDEGCVAAVQWVLSTSAGSGAAAADADRLVDQALRQLTLGGRRALARRATGETIQRLAVDPDPGVIRNLLNNPRVTEETVLKICSRRPTVTTALEAVLAAPRWIRRHRVRVALAKNPYLAESRAINLLVYLTRRELRQVRDDDTLSSMLRLAAQRLLDIPID
jgi:hypothetical protein